MTHDELLELINNYKIYAPVDYGQFDLTNALRAVVELHKAQEITLPNGEWGSNCIICDGWSYPCRTIQAIEKELG